MESLCNKDVVILREEDGVVKQMVEYFLPKTFIDIVTCE